MDSTDVIEIKKEVAELKVSLKDIAKQYHEMKHNNADTSQGVINAQRVLNRIEPIVDKIFEKITGDEKFGNLGIVQILKNQEKFNEDIDKRVSDIEEIGRTEEKLLTYKKGLLYTIFGTIGMGILTLLKTFGAWIFEHFKF